MHKCIPEVFEKNQKHFRNCVVTTHKTSKKSGVGSLDLWGARETMMLSRKIKSKNREEKPVRSIDETLDFLRTASRITAARLDILNKDNAHDWQIERVRQRQKLILETIKAVEEACSMNA